MELSNTGKEEDRPGTGDPGTVVKFEDVLESIGGFGWYQKLFTVLTIGPQLTAAMVILSPVFTGTDKVPLYCSNNTVTTNECGLNCTVPTEGAVYSSIVQEWDLVCSRNWVVDAINSFQMAGMMSGALLSSLISDRFGRIKSYFFITIAMGLCGMLPALSWNPWFYAVARFLAGVGIGGCFVAYLVHLMEFLVPEWRTICGAVSFWPFGEMLLSLISYYVKDWRILTAITSAPVFLVLLGYPFIQESPRWLLTRKRTGEAYDILCKVAKWNSRPPPDYNTVASLQNSVLKEEESVVKGLDGVKEIIRDKHLRLHLFIVVWANITCAVIYYGVSFSVKSLSGNPSLNILYSGILDFLAIPCVFAFNDRIGRKKTFMLFMAWSSLFMMLILGLEFSSSIVEMYPMLITVFALLSRLGIVSGWSCLTCIILESFPTTLRSSCLGFCAFIGYLGSIVAPQSVFLGTIFPSLPYILYCVLASTSFGLSLLLNEMNGKPLADTVKS